MDLLDENGELLSHNDFCQKYDFNFSVKDFKSLTKAIPDTFLFLAKNVFIHSQPVPQPPTLCINGINFLGKKLSDKFIRSILTNDLYPAQSYRNILNIFDKPAISKLRTNFFLNIQKSISK